MLRVWTTPKAFRRLFVKPFNKSHSSLLAHHQDQDDEESTRHVLFQSIHKNVIKKK
jgi:hypothetical protein